jgi:hypothetical protein
VTHTGELAFRDPFISASIDVVNHFDLDISSTKQAPIVTQLSDNNDAIFIYNIRLLL